ncbi:hypothetical protein [Nocardioides ungokensis]|uniref:hypothetical protein n=1 Tax=Nocardioides ungokensis TaxID=1643322 RepID=UPI0015DF06AE|nr:hypothetical protein [Nocardioides ungokensis]
MHELSDARFLEILKSVRSTGSAKVDEPGQRLREYVALSSAFDAASLPGAGSGLIKDPEVDQFLARDCEPVRTRSGEKWRLVPTYAGRPWLSWTAPGGWAASPGVRTRSTSGT